MNSSFENNKTNCNNNNDEQDDNNKDESLLSEEDETEKHAAALSSPSSPSSSCSSAVVVEQTIETMERAHLCMHPVHKHSFAPVTFLISGSMRKCSGCHGRLKSVVLGTTAPHQLLSGVAGSSSQSAASGDQVVRCMACYIYAHRSCALNPSPHNDLWKESNYCSVNTALATTNQSDDKEEGGGESSSSNSTMTNNEQQYPSSVTTPTTPIKTPSPPPLPSPPLHESLSHDKEKDAIRDSNETLKNQSTIIPVTEKFTPTEVRDHHVLAKADSENKVVAEATTSATIMTTTPPQQKSILERISSSTSSLLSLAGVGATIGDTTQIPTLPQSQQDDTTKIHTATDADEKDKPCFDETDQVTDDVDVDKEALLTIEKPSNNNNDDKNVQEEETRIQISSGCSNSGNDDDDTSNNNMNDDTNAMVWTPNGPPPHWASNSSLLEGISETKLQQQQFKQEEEGEDKNTGVVDNETSTTDETSEPLDHTSHPFASVSRVLQENVLAYFQRTQFQNEELIYVNKETGKPIGAELTVHSDDDNDDGGGENASVDKGAIDVDSSSIAPPTSTPSPRQHHGTNEDVTEPQQQNIIHSSKSEDTIESSSTSCVAATEDVDVKSLLTEVSPPIPPEKVEKPSVTKLASDGLAAVRESRKAQQKFGVAAVAGGVAGGAAGLFLAGPAGAVIGAKCGQTVGMLGVILEGSVSVGVFVAGVAAASYTAQQLQLKEEKRIIALGEDGTRRKVLLVRPNVSVDPIWEELTADAIRSSPTNSKRRAFGIIPNIEGRQAAIAQQERHQRDSDIVETDEYEIPTEDKVLLLVSRSLNDKYSLPGHVYRCLIQHYIDRCQEREKERERIRDAVAPTGKQPEEMDEIELLDIAKIEQNRKNIVCRDRRRDAHGVIKYVTATLLEARPGFASSPTITEMSASAVEGLVFGELYDSVFEEIIEETKHSDQALLHKISEFESGQTVDTGDTCTVSQPAMDAIEMLTSAHSAVDKLRHCVHFLELISEHFASPDGQKRSNGAITADSLLKMVCQHIIAAKVPNINAEIAFLEEFARDEQLLRGREGYALVTIQASLHFLNSCNDFQSDIFDQEDEE